MADYNQQQHMLDHDAASPSSALSPHSGLSTIDTSSATTPIPSRSTSVAPQDSVSNLISPTSGVPETPVSLSRRVTEQSQRGAPSQFSAVGNGERQSGAASLYPYSQDPRLSYIDENYEHYATPTGKGDPYYDSRGDVNLVENAAGYAGADGHKYSGFEFADSRSHPVDEKQSALRRFLNSGQYPIEQRIEDKKRGIGRQKYPIVVWALTIAMIGVFINELVVNSKAQGTPVSFHPVVNPMLGPSSSALINVGARFPACMKNVSDLPVTTLMPCLNDTANPPDSTCTIAELCDLTDDNPNQAYRFVSPIFVHAGFVHIILNLLGQMTAVAQVEREMGSAGFIITYFAAGIFGNVLGGNFALVGLPSMGASGAIVGATGVAWVDLIAHWKYHYRPVRRLVFMIIELVIIVAMGFIPYVDNFAHLGGLLMGLLVGMVFYPIISETKKHKMFAWGFRIAALPLVIVLFVVLTRNFYTSDPYAACSWCRYLSCIPTSSNNHCQGTGLTTYTTTSN